MHAALAFLLAAGPLASGPPALTEAIPGLALRWRPLPLRVDGRTTARLAAGVTAQGDLSDSPVLRLRGRFAPRCAPLVSRRFGGAGGTADVPLPPPQPTGEDLVVILPPALAPTEGRDEKVSAATVTVTLPPGCPPVTAGAYQGWGDVDPAAGALIDGELERLRRSNPGEEALVRWLEAPHPHRWQEEAALALALPRLAAPSAQGAADALAAGLLAQASLMARTTEAAFSLAHDLTTGPTQSLPGSGGSWMAVKPGAGIDLDVTGVDLVRVSHRALATTDTGAPLAWRLALGFDDDPPLPVLAHAPLDQEAADVARARTRTMVVPPGARQLRIRALDAEVLVWVVGVRPKASLIGLGRRSPGQWLARAAELGQGWPSHLARSEMSDEPGVPGALLALAQARRTADPARLLALATARLATARSPLERAAARVVEAMVARLRAERAVAAGNPGQAVAALLGLAARVPLCDEDAQALMEADAFAEESLGGSPQALLAVDGLLARRPLDHDLAVARQRAFQGAARWDALSWDPGPREIPFLDPLPPDTASGVWPEHSWFAPVTGEGRAIELPRPALPTERPLLSLIALRKPGTSPLIRMRVDGTAVAVPATGPLERIDLPTTPGSHRVELAGPQGSEVLVNWALGAGPGRRWRRYVELGRTPLELHNRDLGPGDLILVAVRLVAPAGTALRPFDLLLSGTPLRVRPGPLVAAAAGDLDRDLAATEPVEAIVPVAAASPSFFLSTRGLPAGVRVLVQAAVRRRQTVGPPREPPPALRQRLAETVSRDPAANLEVVSAITRRLGGAGARAFLARALALAALDQPALAREDLIHAVPAMPQGTERHLALTLWRHLEQTASSSQPETVDRPVARAPAPVPGRLAALGLLIDDPGTLRRLDAAGLRAVAGDLAVMAAARQAERDGALARAADLWHILAGAQAEADLHARAAAALLALPPDALRDVSAYLHALQATRQDPHHRAAARLFRQAVVRTRLRPVHEVEGSAGVVNVDLGGADPFDASVEAALLPGGPTRPGDLVTRNRQLSLSFELAAPISLRLEASVRELRPQGARAAGSPGAVLEWLKDGEAPHQVPCGRNEACRSAPISLPAGAHSLIVRLQGGLRPAGRVLLEPVGCGGRCGRSPLDHSAEYLVARPEQPVVVTLFGPAVVETELRAPAERQVSVAVVPSRGPIPAARHLSLPPADEAPARGPWQEAVARPAAPDLSTVETVVLDRDETYRVEVRPAHGSVMCRLLVREGVGAATPPTVPATLRASDPPPLLAPPDLTHALQARVDDGDLAPGAGEGGTLTFELGWRSSVDLTEQTGELAPRRAALAALTYRRLIDPLHLTLKLGGEARLWQAGRPSQAGNLDAYFMHPAARWARVFATADTVTQPAAGSAVRGQLLLEPIATLASGVHLVSKVGLSARRQTAVTGGDLDPELASPYLARHPRALFWEEDLELAPLADLLVFGGGRVTTSSDLSPRHPDHASATIVARTVLGGLFVEAGFRWSWFLVEEGRRQAILSRRASLALLHTVWIGHQHALTVGLQAAEHIDLGRPEIALRLGWELTNGRRFKDHTPVEGENYFYPARGPGRELGRLMVE